MTARDRGTVGKATTQRHRLLFTLGLVSFFGTLAQPGYPAPSELVAAGAALFTSSGCPQCHGPEGEGTAKAPTLRDLRKHLKPDATRRQIHDGGANMPPFGDALTDDQINSLVEFLQSKNGWKLVAKASN